MRDNYKLFNIFTMTNVYPSDLTVSMTPSKFPIPYLKLFCSGVCCQEGEYYEFKIVCDAQFADMVILCSCE